MRVYSQELLIMVYKIYNKAIGIAVQADKENRNSPESGLFILLALKCCIN